MLKHISGAAQATAAVALAWGVTLQAHAAGTTSARRIVDQALSCDIAPGQAKTVIAALSQLGAKADGSGTHVLPGPLLVSGLPASAVHVDDADGVETYVAIFHDVNVKSIAAGAQLKPLAASYVRDTKHGRLSADVRDRKDVWLSCTITQ